MSLCVVILTKWISSQIRSSLYISNESLTSVAEGHNSLIRQSCQRASALSRMTCKSAVQVNQCLESTYHYPKQVAVYPMVQILTEATVILRRETLCELERRFLDSSKKHIRPPCLMSKQSFQKRLSYSRVKWRGYLVESRNWVRKSYYWRGAKNPKKL